MKINVKDGKWKLRNDLRAGVDNIFAKDVLLTEAVLLD